MNTFMTFDKEAAQKAGGSDYVMETGGYTGAIQAKAITAKSGSLGIEFSMKTDEGLQANYIQIYFQKSDGERIKSGYGHLQSLMGLLQIGELAHPQSDQNGDCWINELCNKRVGLFLQKRMYTKNNGEDGYDFQLRAVFDPQTLQTYKEKSNGVDAQRVPYMDENTKDLDERNANAQPAQQAATQQYDF